MRPSPSCASTLSSPASSSTKRPKRGSARNSSELLARYFRLEDPTTITPIGLELKLEVEVGGVQLRGIIDRLELDADGELVVTDYKTGKAPGERQEQQRLAGVAFYSLLCERLFGKRPAHVQLLYLADPVAIISTPTDRSTRGVERKLAAIWMAIEPIIFS